MLGSGSSFPDRTHPSLWFSYPSALSSAPASALRGPAPNAILSDPIQGGRHLQFLPGRDDSPPLKAGKSRDFLSITPQVRAERGPLTAPLPTVLHHHHPGHMGEGWTMGTGETMREEQRGIRKQMEQEKKVEGRGGGECNRCGFCSGTL